MRQLVLVTALLTAACAFSGPTEAFFNFDTEDYVADYPNDAVRDLANLLTEEGVVGQLEVVSREQLGSFAHMEGLERHVIAGGRCIHSPEFTDKYLSNRLRYQLWMLRHE